MTHRPTAFGYAGFLGASLLAALAAAAAVGLTSTTPPLRVAAAALAAGVWIAGIPGVRGRRVAALIAAACGVVLLALFAYHTLQLTPPFRLRALHTGAAALYGAVLLSVLVRALRITDQPRALLLACSLFGSLYVADLLIPRRVMATTWEVISMQDPIIGFRYVPHTTAANYYPDNPRGYFWQTSPEREVWALETHEAVGATIDHRGAGRVTFRISNLPERADGDTRWWVKAQIRPFAVTKDQPYLVRFKARSDVEREIGMGVSQAAEPWTLLSAYHAYPVGPDWRTFEFSFTAPADEKNARLFFDLGSGASPVEIDGYEFLDVAQNLPVEPTLPAPRFYVSYRLNGFGFRGPDYAIPKPPATFRIVALGDSFTQGVGVHEADTFTVQLQERLNRRPSPVETGRYFEVVNAGITGYWTGQQRLTHEHVTAKYTPNLVLLMMVVNDDIPYEEEVRRGFIPRGPDDNLFKLGNQVQAISASDRPHDYTDAMAEARRLSDLCMRLGSRLAVVVFRTNNHEAWRTLFEGVRATFAGTDVPVLDLGETLLNGRSEEDLFVHTIDRHPNEIAHRLAAEAIDRWLTDTHLID